MESAISSSCLFVAKNRIAFAVFAFSSMSASQKSDDWKLNFKYWFSQEESCVFACAKNEFSCWFVLLLKNSILLIAVRFNIGSYILYYSFFNNIAICFLGQFDFYLRSYAYKCIKIAYKYWIIYRICIKCKKYKNSL